MLIDITNGDFSNAGGDAVDLLVDGSSNLNITIDPTPGTGAGGNGVLARVLDGSTLTGLFEDTDFSGAALEGMHLEVLGTGSVANLTFDNYNFSNSGGDGFNFFVNGGQMTANFLDGEIDTAGGNGIRGIVANNALANLTMTNFSVENATLFGICVDVLNQSTFNGTFTNGSFANAGLGPVCFNVDGNSDVNVVFDNVNFNSPGVMCGIDFVVTGGSAYNVSVFNSNLSNFTHSAVCGEVFDAGSSATVTLVDVFADNSGLSGIDVLADEGSITINTTDTSIDNSGLDGITMVLTNGATGDLNILNTSIENSDRHGIFVDATNSMLDPSSITNSSLNGSGAGGAGNALFFDLDNSEAPLVQISNTTANNAADDGLFVSAVDGSIFNAEIAGGSFDDAGDSAIHAVLVDNSLVTIETDGTSAERAGINGLLVDGTIGSTFNGTFNNGSFDDAGVNAVEINLDNSDGTINMDNMTGANAGLNGFLADLDNGSELTGIITDGSFSDNGNNAIRALLDNASTADLIFTNTPGANSVADGMFFDVDNTSELTAAIVNGNFDNSGINAIRGILDTNSTATITLTNTSAENADEDGLFVTATNSSIFDLTTTGGSFDNAGQDGAATNRNGIELDFDNSTALLEMDGTTAANAPQNGLLLNFNNGAELGSALDPASIDNGSFINAGINAVQANFDNTSIGFLEMTNTSGANAGADGFLGNVDNGSELTIDIIGGSFSDNGDNALDFNVDNGSLVDITMQGTTNENSVDDGLNFNVDNASTFNGNFTSVSFNNSGGDAIQGILDNGSQSELLLTGTTGDDAGGNGLSIIENNGSNFTGVVTGGSFVNAALNALEFDIDASTAAFTLNGAPANNAGENGLFFELTNGAVFGTAVQPVTILNSNFANSGINAVRGTLDTASSGAVTMDNTSGFESGFDGLHLDVQGASDLIFDASNGTFSNSGQDVASPLTERNAINLNVVAASSLDLTLTNIDAANILGNTTQENGLLFNVAGGSTLTADISSTIANAPSNYSDNNVNAVQGTLDGAGTVVDISMDGITADNSGEDGVHIVQTNESSLDFDILGSVNASSVSGSGGHGIFATNTGNGGASDTTASFTFDNVTIDNNGLDALQGGDGINVAGSNGGTIDLTTSGGSVSTNRDVGIRIAVSDELSPFTLNMNGTTVNANQNGEGLLANITGGGLFNATIVDGSFTGNGVLTPASGFKATISGTNGGGIPSEGNITFDGTELNDNTIHGMEYLVNLGAELNVDLNDVTISNNRFSGISFQAFNANTVASLTMTGNNVISENGDTTDFDGVDIDAIDIQSLTVSIAGTIQANGNDGVNINASNTTIDALSITGSIIENGTFAGGQGSGVSINLDNTLVSDFSVLNAIINENTGDGLVLAAANGSLINNGIMSLSTFSGNTGGSGIVIDLTDSDAPNFQIVENTDISDNDENGIVVRLNNSPLTGLTISDNFNLDNGNLIEGISNNGLNGILIDITDSKLTDLEINDNFIDANQGGDGVSFVVTDSDIEGMIDGNTITNNTGNGIGFDNLVSTAPTMTIDFGTVASNRYIINNEISGNGGSGIFIDLDDNMNFLAQLGGNTIDDNNVGFRLRAHGDATFTTEFGNALLPVAANTFDGNSDAGIAYELTRQFLGDTVDVVGNVTISDVTITDTVNGTSSVLDGSGIHIRMNDNAALNTAVIDNQNAVIGNNAADGITIEIAEDAAIPDLQIRDAQITNNNAHGINIQRFDRTEIVGTIENINATLNTLNGFNLFATNRQTPELLFTFNDNNFSENDQDGMSFETEADVILRLNGDRNTISDNGIHGMSLLTGEDSAIGNPLTLTASVFNNTIITGNGADGVNLTADNNSRILIDFLSPIDPQATDRTQITGNGNNGLTLVSNSTTQVTFTLQGADVTGNGVDGFNSTSNSSSLMDLTIGGAAVGEDNVISENGNDGIDLNTTGSSVTLVDVVENILNFNGNDGVSITLGGTSNFTGTFTDSTMNNNTARGFDYAANSSNGSRIDPVDVTLTGNVMNDNLLEGVRVVTDANLHQNRTVLFDNTGFPSDNRPFPGPFDPVLLATPGYEPTNGFGDTYLNTFTTQATNLVITNNTIRDNGTGTDSHGLLMQIGTSTYVSADVQNNVFGGNVLSDFNTSSFLSAAPSASSLDTSGAGTFDIVLLNDTAQLDLRFNLNSGDQITPSSNGAARFFQVDDGPNLNFPNNDFEQFGVQQDINSAFSTGNYHLRGAADPLFPNPAFPPFLP
ncbi:MAG: hypothetical protein ACKVT0_05225 [Planctomycetaceae bacterium]